MVYAHKKFPCLVNVGENNLGGYQMCENGYQTWEKCVGRLPNVWNRLPKASSWLPGLSSTPMFLSHKCKSEIQNDGITMYVWGYLKNQIGNLILCFCTSVLFCRVNIARSLEMSVLCYSSIEKYGPGSYIFCRRRCTYFLWKIYSNGS